MKNIDESSTMRGSLTKTECAQVRRMVLELGEVEASRRIRGPGGSVMVEGLLRGHSRRLRVLTLEARSRSVRTVARLPESSST
jgi:hypothetical protein